LAPLVDGPKIVGTPSSPVTELWNSAGRVALQLIRELGKDDIAELLRQGVTRFVIAGSSFASDPDAILAPRGVNHGWRLKWVESECFPFWKKEVKPRLVEPGASDFRLEDFSDQYCYSATKWSGPDGTVIFLWMHH
jgi:hypothetical protein